MKKTTTLVAACLLYIISITNLKAQQPKEDANALKEEADKLKAVTDTSAKYWKHG